MTQDLVRHINAEHSQSDQKKLALDLASLSSGPKKSSKDKETATLRPAQDDDAKTPSADDIFAKYNEEDEDSLTASIYHCSTTPTEEYEQTLATSMGDISVQEVHKAEDCIASHMRDLSLQFTLPRLGQATPTFLKPAIPAMDSSADSSDDDGRPELDVSVDLFDPKNMKDGIPFEFYMRFLKLYEKLWLRFEDGKRHHQSLL
ncbi:hypothetical protein ISF_08021 [Cordyceps fumosorosea ARSEF 2679]|uniref:Uncharacterized protein n=1 Tax=Cordyceps fumosorosea (strain ARSEF 2679) TaxID=1081104 RepID=A0A162MEP2_CORFA|nr:hypothetical protein ISF_08021 [Cordyceps fumosorosea ARSEF 2679]OAA55100.1 hypothetical protein ISF_08021 [Cordyceps fumosorosea ARSEF 2679]